MCFLQARMNEMMEVDVGNYNEEQISSSDRPSRISQVDRIQRANDRVLSIGPDRKRPQDTESSSHRFGKMPKGDHKDEARSCERLGAKNRIADARKELVTEPYHGWQGQEYIHPSQEHNIVNDMASPSTFKDYIGLLFSACIAEL
jgi:hypothetical protein